jgi:MYXO-CTERM domain-containing protein
MSSMTLRKRVLGPVVAASLALSAAVGVASAQNYDPQTAEERTADDGDQDWGWVGLLGLAGLLGLRRRDRHDEHMHRTTP